MTDTTSRDALRDAIGNRGWFIARVSDASWVESTEWVPVIRAALTRIEAALTRPAPDAIDVDVLARAPHFRDSDELEWMRPGLTDEAIATYRAAILRQRRGA